jgi:hypothetical protein
MIARRRLFVWVLGAAATACGPAAEATGDALESASAFRSKGSVCPPTALVDLLAIGTLSGTRSDRSTSTAAPLENGTAGNLLGGIGSGLAHARGDIFVAVPDRGPNAVSYNAAVDDTTSYINRLQTLRLKLSPCASSADASPSNLPFSLTPTLLDTTLLSSKDPLVYGSGAGAGLAGGAPAQNTKHVSYFTGRSDNFDPAQASSDADDGRFDPESIRISKNGKSAFVSDEYGPFVYEFDRDTGRRTRVLPLPPKFSVAQVSARGDTEISGNTSGRVANKGMEGLAISPSGKKLFGAMQSALIQDGGVDGRFVRVVAIDIDSGATQEFAYELTNIGTDTKPKYPTVSEIVAVNEHEFLVDERDGKGLGDDSTAAYKRIYHVDFSGAADVSNVVGEANLAGQAATKTLLLDVVATLNAHGVRSEDIPAKLESLAFGDDVTVGCRRVHTLYVANDNDFVGRVVDTNHPDGIDNPNTFFVFAVDAAALPGFSPQKMSDGE